jgi:hypothetical protein
MFQHILGLCQTNVGGTLTQNTVWSLAGSPYTLTSAVGVLPSVTLTIQPGVQVIGNFDIVIRGGTLLMSGVEGQRIKVQGSRILFKSSDLSRSNIAYVDFNQAGVQLGDENEFNQDNVKNSNTLIVKKATFSNNSFGRTKGYQTTAKLRFELSSINNSLITGYYPRSEPVELDEVDISNSTITSESYNFGIKVTNSIVNNTSFLIGCCSANFDIFNTEINNSSFREGSGTPVNGLIRLQKANFTDTYFSLPSAKFLMTDCTAKVSSSIPVFINMGNGEIKNSSIEGNSSTTLFKVTGRSGYNVGGSVVFQKMNFNLFGTAIEILNFGQLTIFQNNFLSASSFNLKNSSNKDITATGNYWGTVNEQTIKDKIYDIYDNINSGLVNYNEFLQFKVLESQTITFTSLANKTFGDVPFALSGSSSSGLALTYTSSNTAVATVTGNMVTIVGAGATTITAKQEGNTNYDPAVDVGQSLTINKASQTITFATLANKTFGDASFTLSGTSSSGLALTYTSSNTAVATVSGNTVTIVGAGSTVITASQTGNNNYNPAVDVAQSLTVNKASQTITFTTLANKTFGDAPFTLSGTSSSGLALTYTSSNTAVATVSGNTVTIVGAGATVITASQTGNNNYNPAVDVAQSLTVNKASQTITFAALSNKTFGDAPFTLSGTSSSGLPVTYISSNTAVATVSGNTVTIVGVGTTTITAKQAGNNNYNPAVDVAPSLTVNKASQTITFATLANKTFGDVAFALSGTSSSGLALTYTSSNTAVATVTGNTVTIVGVGTSSITAKQAGNNNYNPAADVIQSLTVNKASQTITFAALSNKAFGDAPFTLSGTSSSGLAMTYTSDNTAVATVTGNTVTIVGVGTSSITAKQAGNNSYNPAVDVAQSLTVNKASQTITFAALSNKTFGDAPFTLSGTSSSGLAVTYTSSNTAIATISGNTVTIVGAGTTTITAKQAGNNNYNPAVDVAQSLTVNKAPQTITFTALGNRAFGDAPFTLSGTSSSGQAVTYISSNTSVATVSGNTVTIVGAGTTTITAKQAGNNNYDPAVDLAQSLTVNKANQTITFTSLANKTFGEVPFALSGTSSSGLAVTYVSSNTAVATISGNTLTIVGAGTATLTAKQAGNNNYNPAVDVAQSLTVNKAPQTTTFAPLANKIYGDVPFVLPGTSSSGLTLTYTSGNTAVATVSGNTVTIVGVGTATITAKQAGNSNYNPSVDVGQSLTVNKASQTITFAALSSKTFGDAPFTLAGTSSSGLVLTYTSSNTAVATVSGNTVTIVGVGSATITAKQAGNANHNSAVDVAQPLTVNKANQTITFTALPSKTFGDAPFTLSGTSSSGLPLTYSSSNGAVATVSGNTVTIVGAGVASITASQAGNANYNSGETSRQLTVNKALQTITFTALSNKTFGDAPFNLSGTSSSGLPLTFTSGNTAVATVSGITVTIVGAGTITITASQAGNNNYNPAETPQSFTVNKSSQTITFAALESQTFGDAPLSLPGSSSSGLTLTYSSSDTGVAVVSGSTVTILGAGTATITAKQAGNDNYNPAVDVSRQLTVNKASQNITFAPLEAKTFGDVPFTLSASASSALPITYASSDPSVVAIDGNTVTILRAGTTTITAGQAGNINYLATADKQQVLTISKAQPSLSWPTPADIDFGTSLNSTQLNATSSISGSFTYAPTAGTKLTAGSGQRLSVTFTPTDAVNYNSATKQVFINVNKIAPAITWSSPADIVYGTVLGTTQLNATASVNGTFSYTPATGTKLSAGVNQLSVTFTPTDAVNYSSATKVVTINVSKATPAVSWSKPADIVYGTALSSAQLNATSLEGGIFTYTPSGGEKLNAGNGQQLSVTFSPSDAVNFTSVTKQVMLNVSKATPAITWSTPADLVYGTPLSSVQLNATSLVAGTFFYTPAIGVTLNAGNGQQLLVTFAPTDAANYVSTTASVSINVARAQLQISFAAIADKTLGNEPFVLTASANSSLPVIFSSNSDKVSIANNQVTLLKAGRVSITASQIGNENFNVASSVTQSFCIKPAKPTVTISNINTPTPLLTSNASAGNQWYADGTAIAGATSATFSAIKSGNYKVQVTVDDCTGEFSAEQPLVITGIEAIGFPIELYPNPVSDVLTIYFGDLAGNKQATIFTLAGQELISTKTQSGSIAIDVSDLSAGMYLAKVIAGGTVHTKKFKKQ